MTIYFATDHAGFELKNELLAYVKNELGYTVEDCGAHELDVADDYPDFVHKAAAAVSEDPENRQAIIVGASGQGEAICANRHKGIRAVLYYGEPAQNQVDAAGKELDMIESTRVHNAANVLSLGARFISTFQAKEVVQKWLEVSQGSEERHVRRIQKLDSPPSE
jgi:ribose 5-phosphate isomerase B